MHKFFASCDLECWKYFLILIVLHSLLAWWTAGSTGQSCKTHQPVSNACMKRRCWLVKSRANEIGILSEGWMQVVVGQQMKYVNELCSLNWLFWERQYQAASWACKQTYPRLLLPSFCHFEASFPAFIKYNLNKVHRVCCQHLIDIFSSQINEDEYSLWNLS